MLLGINGFISRALLVLGESKGGQVKLLEHKNGMRSAVCAQDGGNCDISVLALVQGWVSGHREKGPKPRITGPAREMHRAVLGQCPNPAGWFQLCQGFLGAGKKPRFVLTLFISSGGAALESEALLPHCHPLTQGHAAVVPWRLL